jgi:hypothetical protein
MCGNGYAFPQSASNYFEAVPHFFGAKVRRSLKIFETDGEASPSPHIKRHSRKYNFACK